MRQRRASSPTGLSASIMVNYKRSWRIPRSAKLGRLVSCSTAVSVQHMRASPSKERDVGEAEGQTSLAALIHLISKT